MLRKVVAKGSSRGKNTKKKKLSNAQKVFFPKSPIAFREEMLSVILPIAFKKAFQMPIGELFLSPKPSEMVF